MSPCGSNWARRTVFDAVGVQSNWESVVNRTSFHVSVIAVVATIVLAAVLLPHARSQVQVAPSYIPIGVASSGNSSMAWFHQPSSGRVLACQSASDTGTSVSSIHCVATKLP